MSTAITAKIKDMPCAKCGISLRLYFLKDGICNGCRNPHLIVTTIVKGQIK